MRCPARVGGVAVTPDIRREALFAARTRGDVGEGIASVLALLGMPDVISFAGGFPDPATFPRERVASLLEEFAASGETSAFQYAPTRGLAGPLDAVAGRVETLQGRRPSEEELLLTSGAIEALELVGKSFLDRGDVVVVEAPTYLGAIQAFRASRPTSSPSPWTTTGSRSTSSSGGSPAVCGRSSSTRSPTTRTPPGSASRSRGAGLVELARRYGFVLVEDVAYRELGFDPDAPPSLWSLGPDVVLQTGTTSKTFFPGVRLGWAAGPADVAAQLVAAKQNTDQCAGALGQRLFEESHRRGWIDEQLARSRSLYRGKCERLLAALERSFPDGASWTRPQGGFFSWLTLPAERRLDRARPPGGGAAGRDRARHALLPRRARRRRGAPLVQPRRRGADRRGDRAARVAPADLASGMPQRHRCRHRCPMRRAEGSSVRKEDS